MKEKSSQTRIHVVAIPYPAQGHINPMLQLCLQLVPRGFCFTFVNTEHTHQRMLKQQSQNHHEHEHIRMVCIEGGLPPELHGYKDTRAQGFQAAQLLRPDFENLLSSLINNSNNYPTTTTEAMTIGAPSIILTDILLGWTKASATTFGLSRVVFWCASATTLSTLLYMAHFAENNLKIDLSNGILSDIPGVPPTHVNLLPKLWDIDGGFTSIQSQFTTSALRTMDEAKCLILNTFPGLEGSTIKALKCRVPVIEVGPLMPCQYISPKEGNLTKSFHKIHKDEGNSWFENKRMSLFEEDKSCLKWLHEQKEDSVLFISFGSISVRNDEQMLELARALEATNCKFIWIRRPRLKDNNNCKIHDASSITNDISRQAQVEILRLLAHMKSKGQGVAVEWAPQLEVLAHQAVAGFITHCGWNSIMESVTMGIPLLCWADTGERMSNQRLVVDFWGCGVDVDVKRRTLDNLQDYDKQGAILCSNELQSVIKSFMTRPSKIVKRAKELKHIASVAFFRASSNLDKFGESLHSTLKI